MITHQGESKAASCINYKSHFIASKAARVNKRKHASDYLILKFKNWQLFEILICNLPMSQIWNLIRVLVDEFHNDDTLKNTRTCVSEWERRRFTRDPYVFRHHVTSVSRLNHRDFPPKAYLYVFMHIYIDIYTPLNILALAPPPPTSLPRWSFWKI